MPKSFRHLRAQMSPAAQAQAAAKARAMLPDATAPRQDSWCWMCADCHGSLAVLRDNVQGRRLLAVLVREAEATAEALMQQGLLRRTDLTSGLHWTCCCDDHGPALAPEVLAQRRVDDP